MSNDPTPCLLSTTRVLALTGALVLSACARPASPDEGAAKPNVASRSSADASTSADRDTDAPAPTATPPADPATPSARDADTPARPDPSGSLPEPRTPPAESSPQAAATTTETYFALLQAGKTSDADRLWHDAAQASAFRAQFESLGRPQVEVDAPGGMEGAAGSSYVTVPVRFLAPAGAANPRPRNGEVVLRRVNDVTGSTAEQRRWHIDRIDVAMTPK